MSVLLVDGLNLIYRAYHAYNPRGYLTPDGRPAWAAFGAVILLHRAALEAKADGVIVAGERGPTWRRDEYPEYKGRRDGRPSELAPQLPLVVAALRILGVPIVTAPGHEADDVLATLATRFVAAGRAVAICSNDRDLWQLSAPGVTLMVKATTGGPPSYEMLDRPAVMTRLGIRPEQLPDWKALAGDKTDNIPGVPGIGPRAACDLLAYYGRLEVILEQAPTMGPGAKRARLMEHADRARLWLRLATLTRDLDLPEIEPRPWLADADLEAMGREFPAMGLGRLVDSLRAAAMLAKAVAA